MSRLEELDRLSRLRPLTKAESYELEREIAVTDGRRIPWGLTRALARQGLRRRRR